MSKLIINLPQPEANFAILQSKNPEAALLYIYGLANGGVIDTENAQNELALDDETLKKASDSLLAYSVCKFNIMPQVIVAPTIQDMNNLRKTDYGFKGICQVYEKAKGTPNIRKSEIESLYNIYVNLNMSADMITLLIGFLCEKNKFSLRNLEKTAYEWHEADISTYEAAEQYMKDKFIQKNQYRDILKALHIYGRDPVTNEKKYLDSWIEKKIPLALISLAYERMIYNISEFKWPYINKILINWNNAGYRSPQDVANGEPSGAKHPAENEKTPKNKQTILLEEYDKKRHDREQRASVLLKQLTERSESFVENERRIKLVTRKMAAAAVSGSDVSIFKEQLDELNKKRKSILLSAGYNINDVFPKPDCPLCNDYGYIGSEMCQCFKEKLEKM